MPKGFGLAGNLACQSKRLHRIPPQQHPSSLLGQRLALMNELKKHLDSQEAGPSFSSLGAGEDMTELKQNRGMNLCFIFNSLNDTVCEKMDYWDWQWKLSMG